MVLKTHIMKPDAYHPLTKWFLFLNPSKNEFHDEFC